MRHSASAPPAARPEVLIFATGGTIGMRETDRGLAPDPGFEEALDHMVQRICEPLGIDYRINHLSPAIDSANADAETGARIARAVRARVRTKRPSGVVITHGTDTLAYTGARIAFEFDGLGVPVVLTGSQLAHGAPSSDAHANLSLAIRAAVKAGDDAPACIAFGGALIPAIRATKAQAEELRAFRAERDLGPTPIGVPKKLLSGSDRVTPARTLAFRFVPGVVAEDLRAAVGGGPDGLVLECYGSGNAPMARPGMADVLREICGVMPVVAITQCATGSVDPGRYAVGSELADTGVIAGGDMTAEAALAKLAFGIDAGLDGAALREFMTSNIVGERQ
ncbi:MAG: asparaginase domain-containing protein [Actinobacteria bacterium]|nr:asparaginase domain-containing protein [Actinomycetota bacterium]